MCIPDIIGPRVLDSTKLIEESDNERFAQIIVLFSYAFHGDDDVFSDHTCLWNFSISFLENTNSCTRKFLQNLQQYFYSKIDGERIRSSFEF